MKNNIKIDYDDENNIDEEFINEEPKKKHIIRRIFFGIVLIIALIILYARYVGTTGLIIKEYSINTSVPKSFDGLKIAHFSDFHYGRTTNIDSLKNLVKEINLIKPDIIVFTGDFIDKDVKVNNNDINNIKNELSKLNSTYGKYYVTGNHDIKNEHYNEIFDYAGFSNINDNYDIIYSKDNEPIILSGTNYNSDLNYLNDLFTKELPSYKINIMHTPDTFDDIKNYNFNLVLAGHSHNGQVDLPFYGAIYTPKGAKKYYKPYYKIDNTDLYISSGIGTSTYNFRLFNRPSFNLYRLNAK